MTINLHRNVTKSIYIYILLINTPAILRLLSFTSGIKRMKNIVSILISLINPQTGECAFKTMSMSTRSGVPVQDHEYKYFRFAFSENIYKTMSTNTSIGIYSCTRTDK